jgi:hypothetical protein
MMLTAAGVEDTICYFHNLWNLVLLIFPGDKRYIRAGFSRRIAGGIPTASTLSFDLLGFYAASSSSSYH